MKCLIEKRGRFIHTQLCYRPGLWTSQKKDARVFATIRAAEEFAADNALDGFEIVPLQKQASNLDNHRNP
jgi:hypothetical protein